GSFLTAALMWGQAHGFSSIHGRTYSWILLTAWQEWPWQLGIVFVVCVVSLAVWCYKATESWQTPILVAVATSAISYLILCGLLRFYGEVISGSLYGFERGEWLAFVFGPPIAMAGVA